MQIINVPGIGEVDFPDEMSEKDIVDAISGNDEMAGASVASALRDGRDFKPSEQQFSQYEKHLKSDDNDTPWTQLMYDAAGHLLSTAGSAVAGAVTAPHKIPGSVVEGAAQGTQALYQMAAQSEDPDSWAFKLKDKLFNSGTLHERHQMFLEARDFNTEVEKNTSGEETLVMPKAAVDNRLVQGFATVLDPTVVVPGVGEVLGVGRIAARATAKAAIGVGRGLRAVAAPVNSALRVAGEGVAKATGLTAHEMQIAAGAAGAGALANPIGQAVVGTVAAAKGADIVGDTLTRVGRVMRDQPTRIAPFESVALDATAPKGVQKFANLAHRLGGDVALDITPGAVAGMAEGAAVGGALGYYNSGEEGAASGIGGGIAAGGVAAGGVRAVQHLTGHVNVERGRAGGKALVDGLKDGEVIGMDTVETTDASGNKVNTQVARTSNSKTLAQRLVARMGYFAKGGEGMVADFFTHAAEDGTQVVLIDKDTTLPSSFGISSPEDMRGVAITRQVDGKPVIVIHVDNATKDTAGHELFHTLLGEASKSEMKRIGSSKLFGIPGISKGLTSARDLHAWTVNHVKKMAALGNAGWQRAVDTVFNVDPNTKEVTLRTDVPPAKMLEAQHMIADEILAEYGGYDIFGRTLTGRATYSGQLRRNKVNTVFESIAALARDTWMRTTEGQVARDGIFNTETKSLLDSKGKLNRNRELSKFMREVVTRDNSLSEDAVRTRIEFKDTKNLDAINEQLGAGSLFELDNNGKVSRVITPNEDKARGITRHAEVKAELDKIAEHERGVRRSLDENGDEVFNFENATDAELAAVLKFLNPIQQDNVRKIIEGIASRDGQPIHIVTNFAALAKGRNGRNQYRGLAPSERKAILYGLELSKEGNFYARVLDYDQVSRNMAKALRVPEYSKLWANPSDIIVDLKKYLEHLTKSDKPDSAAMFGLNGETKRSFFYEVLGVQPAPTKGAYPERPYRAGFTHSTKDSPFRSMRIDRISRIEATGEKAFFNEAQTHHNAQRNYQPADESGFLPDKSLTDPSRFKAEKLGDTEVHTHESGARVLVKGNVNRVYAADGALLGVTNNDAKAEKLLAKHLEKQNAVELTKDGGVVTGADSFTLKEDVLARFQPASKDIHLEDYADRKVFALTTDRMGIGDAFIGVNGAKKKLSVQTQGGVGFMNIFNGGGWAFAQEATASSFLRRVREVAGGEDSAVVALTILTPENHMKNQTGQLAYIEALHAAVDVGAVPKKVADRHIRELVRRVRASKDATMAAETTLKQKLRGIDGLDSYEAAVRAGTFNFTDEKYLADKKAGRTLPIPHAEAKKLGIAFEDIARDIGDKAFMDEPTGTVVALLEIDANQKPLNDDFHHSYPWSIHGKRIGYLKKFHALKHLTSDNRVFDKRGNINMQPVMLSMPVLDRIREGTARYSPSDESYLKAVKSGDMETAQRMVDEAAKKAGYTSEQLSHGTTHKFTVFNLDRANVENDLGKGFYFSNTADDVSANYAGVGPDLTQRIERLAEQLEGNDGLSHERALHEAAKRLTGKTERVIHAYVKLENPAVIGGDNETRLTYTLDESSMPEEALAESGTAVDLLNSLRENVDKSGGEGGQAVADVVEKLGDLDGVKLSEFVKAAQESEAVMYLEDANTGDLASKEVVRQTLEDAGFDGIIDNTVDVKFGSQRRLGRQMEGMNEDTYHVIAFKPEQIKSSDPVTKDKGKVIPLSQRFDDTKSDIRYQPFSDARTETLGDVTVTTDRSGMKMTQRGSGAARLYAADGRLIGVYTGVSEAIRKASRLAERGDGSHSRLMTSHELVKPSPELESAYKLGSEAGVAWENSMQKFDSAARNGDADYPDFYNDVGDARALFWEAGFNGLARPMWVKAERIGKLPDGTSTNFREQRREPGISVIRLDGQSRTDNGTFDKFNAGKTYKVEGWLHYKRGSDGEPLLVEAKYSRAK